MSRTLVVIPPSPPWWHAHKRGYAYVLCTDPFCPEAPEGTEEAYWAAARERAATDREQYRNLMRGQQ